MKHILFLLLLLPFLAGAQIPVPRSPIAIAPEDANLYVTFVLKLPSFADTTHANTYIGHDSVGILFYNLADSNVYVRDLGLGHHRWKLIGSGGGGAVSSVFGRTGAVVATAADYTSFYPLLSGSYSNPSWINTLAASKISSPGSLTAGSSKITFPSGTPSTALLDPVTIDVVEANFNLANLGGLLGIAQINASGVPSSTTFLRGDGSWASASGGTTYTADETSIHLASTVFGVKSTWVGQTSLTTVGTITTGTWNGTAIANANLANSAITINGVSTSLGGSTSVTDATLSTSNITTNNASTSKHGFVPILPNDATKYYDGTGNYSIPAGVINYNPKNIVLDGGDSTGATNVVPIVQAAIDSGYRNIYFPRGHYKWSTQLNIRDSVHLWGDGKYLTSFVTQANVTLIKFNSVGYGAEINAISFEGTYGSHNGGGGNTSQIAIEIDSVYGVNIHDCKAWYIAGYFVKDFSSGLLPFNQFTYGNKIMNNDAFVCNEGILLGVRAEYTLVSGNSIADGGTGIEDAGGNNTITGNNISTMSTGIKITGGANNGHGAITGNLINHSGTNNIDINGCTLGMDFTNNMIYTGTISIVNSNWIVFNGGDISVTTITMTGDTNCAFNNVNYPTVPTWSVSTSTVAKNDFAVNGMSFWDIVHAKHFDFSNNNSIVHFGATNANVTDNTTQFLFLHPIVGANGGFDAGRDLCVGAARLDFTSSTSTDKFQVYGGTGAGKLQSWIDSSANYSAIIDGSDRMCVGCLGSTRPNAVLDLSRGRTFAGYAPLKFHASQSVVNATSGTGSVATITLATSNLMWWPGDSIVVAGVSPSGYNGRFKIIGVGINTLTYSNTTTGTISVNGSVTAITLLTTPEVQTVEVSPSHIYYTDSSATRLQLDNQATSGSYTPSYTGTANVSSIAALGNSLYTHVGHTVHVNLSASLNPTLTATTTTFTVTIPVSAVTTSQLACGQAMVYNLLASGMYAGMVSITSSSVATVTIFSQNNSNAQCNITFDYIDN